MSVDELKAEDNTAFAEQDFDLAIDKFSKAIELDGSNHVLFSNRSAAYSGLKKYTEAKVDAEKCIEIKSDWSKGYARLGAALHGLKDFDAAITAYENGLKLDAGNTALTSGLESVQKDKAAEAASAAANPFAALFGPGTIDKIKSIPAVSKYLDEPDFVSKINMVIAQPALVQGFMQDQRIMNTVLALSGVDVAAMAQPAPATGTSPLHPCTFASLKQEISLLTNVKQRWEAQTSDALGHIEALQDYASVLRTTLSQVEATASRLQKDYAHRMKALFDEPMDELRRELAAMREECQRVLREDVVPTSLQCSRVVPERVQPLCVLFETYTEVNGERMRLPPDVLEGIIPMVGRRKFGVFYREATERDYMSRHYQAGYVNSHDFFLPDPSISDKDLSSILRQHNWCVIPNMGDLCGITHFYNDADGDERVFVFRRHRPGSQIRVQVQKDIPKSVVYSIVKYVLPNAPKTRLRRW